MSTRYISIEEINSVLAAVEDKKGIDLLRKIRDNIEQDDPKAPNEQKFREMKEEEQAKETERKAFVGFAKEDKIIGGGSGKEGGEEKEGKIGILNRLVDKGLVTKGGFIPKGKDRLNSYKLTNEGYALLNLVERVKGEGSQQQQQQKQQQESTTRAESQKEDNDNNRRLRRER